jgi:glycine/D-amino acid oxidase-like deaminating enzyme
MSSLSFDVIIAGGGIVGASCADSLTQAGLGVALVERDVIGSGATAAGMGHLVVMDDSEAQFALTRHSQLLWSRLASELPPAAEYEMVGTLWVAADEEEMAEAERKHACYRGRGVPSRLLTASELADREPYLRSGLAGALIVPEDAVVYPPVVAMYLARRAERSGATLIAGKSVVEMAAGTVSLDDGTRLHAPCIVNAMGAWSPEMTSGVAVKKRKGHLVITDRYPGFVRHQLVELGYLKSAHSHQTASVAFNVQPRKTGQVLIGSSRQYGEDRSAVDQAMLSAMLERAASYMPRISSLRAIRVWTGFRAATPDKLPLIGPWTQDPSIWLATGHEGLGITTALGTADLLTAMFTGREPPIPSTPYLPARYGPSDNSAGARPKEQTCNGEA